MRMNPDGTIEGTPEEIAAFKHIDAALTKKNGKAFGSIDKPKKKTKPKEIETVEISEVLSDTLNSVKERGGEVTANQVAETLGIKIPTANHRLNRLVALGVLTKPSRGIFQS